MYFIDSHFQLPINVQINVPEIFSEKSKDVVKNEKDARRATISEMMHLPVRGSLKFAGLLANVNRLPSKLMHDRIMREIINFRFHLHSFVWMHDKIRGCGLVDFSWGRNGMNNYSFGSKLSIFLSLYKIRNKNFSLLLLKYELN